MFPMPRPFPLIWIWSLEYLEQTTSYKTSPYVVFSIFYVLKYLLPRSKNINLFLTFLLLAKELIRYHNKTFRNSAPQCIQSLPQKNA
jgi:fucose 4-O-acetylase-like acetyltransferase